MKILLLGESGQLGSELKKTLKPFGELTACSRSTVDLTDLIALNNLIQTLSPDIIVNAAAYTQVEEAEKDEKTAVALNYNAVAVMAQAASELNALLIHYSTDYVFNGDKHTPYIETDLPSPINVYGQTKLAGENVIQSSGARHLILRTSWIYSPHGKNFLRTILKLAKEREQLKVVVDQIGTPNSAAWLAAVSAQVIAHLIATGSLHTFGGGTFHLSAQGQTSWHEFAQTIVKLGLELGITLKLTPENIIGIASNDYPTIAKRPLYSKLDSSKICQTFHLQFPNWREPLLEVMQILATGAHDEP